MRQPTIQELAAGAEPVSIETVQVSFRIPVVMLSRIDAIAVHAGRSRTEALLALLERALASSIQEQS